MVGLKIDRDGRLIRIGADDSTAKPLHELSAEEIAELGVSVEAALEARIERLRQDRHRAEEGKDHEWYNSCSYAIAAYEDARNIIAAQRDPNDAESEECLWAEAIEAKGSE